jgi:hypothetical protein
LLVEWVVSCKLTLNLMRCFSTILFALLAMVLPMAGVQKYFCMVDMLCLGVAENCSVEQEDCCGPEDEPLKEKPDCFVFTKLIPDAEKAAHPFVPEVNACWMMLPVPRMDALPGVIAIHEFSEKKRGSPDGVGLFLLQQRLLI